MNRYISWLYIALVVIVALSVVLRSLLQLCFQEEREQMAHTEMPMLFSAKLEAGIDETRQDEIVAQVSKIAGIITPPQLELPIPPWQGKPEQEKSWSAMWKAYLSPIVYATAENSINNTNLFPAIAKAISEVTGITQVVWDEESYTAFRNKLELLNQKEGFISGFLFLFFIGVTAALLASFPVRFRRKYVVRSGLGGAGSQISPEKVWIKLVGIHLAATIILFSLLWFLVFLLAPADSNSKTWTQFFTLLIEGNGIAAVLVSAVCLIGWWFTPEDVQTLSFNAPPPIDWNQE